jgi:hypothetical protein
MTRAELSATLSAPGKVPSPLVQLGSALQAARAYDCPAHLECKFAFQSGGRNAGSSCPQGGRL